MTIPSLMTILSAPGSPATTTSAVAGAELPGSGQVGFASLVQMLLGQQQAQASEVPGAGADGGATRPGAATGTNAESAEAGSEATEPASGPAGAPAGSSPGPAWGVPAGTANPPASLTPGAHGRGAADGSGSPAKDTGDTDGQASEVAGVLGVAAQASPPVTGRDAAGAAPAGSAAAVADAPQAAAARTNVHVAGPAAQAPADAGSPTAPGTDVTASAGVARDADATAEAGSTAPVPATPQHAADLGQTQPVGAVGAVAVAAPSAGAAHAPTGSAPTAAPVAGQVFPEVVRLVTRGDGTQRLTLRLSPENLGEVRIVVTVRDGGVDVRLAAGADAQDALRHGSADLRRLLEGVGATSTQIVVRDLPGAATSAGGTSPTAQTPGTGAAATYADTSGGHGRDHQRGGDASGHQPGQHQTSGQAHTGVRSQPATPTASAAAAGVDLRL